MAAPPFLAPAPLRDADAELFAALRDDPGRFDFAALLICFSRLPASAGQPQPIDERAELRLAPDACVVR